MNGELCKQDGTNTTVYTGNMSGAIANAQIHSTLDNTYDQTNLDIAYAGIDASGEEWTDIVYYPDGLDSSFDTDGAAGLTYCLRRKSTSACDMAVVILDVPGWCANYRAWTGKTCADQPTVVRQLACHETGHAFGLVHGDNATPAISRDNGDELGCMADMMHWPASTGIGWDLAMPGHHPFQLGPRQVAQINANYR